MTRDLYIALVTPFSWSVPSAVNQHVADLARELKARGHLPVVVVSSDDRHDERRIRALFHRTHGQVVTLLAGYRRGERPDPLLLPTANAGPLGPEVGIPVVPLGSSFPIRFNGGVASLGLPVDVTSRLEKLMLGAGFDLVHVHEPLAPSLSFTALREARSPVVATFHLTPLGVAAYELGQSLLDRFFLRLDGRVVTFPAGRTIMNELYPGRYEVISSGTSLLPGGEASDARAPSAAGPATVPEFAGGPFALYVYRGDGRRSYRALLRALLAAFPAGIERVAVAMHRPSAERWVPRSVPRRLASRLTLLEFEAPDELVSLYRSAAVTILPFLGGEWLSISAAEAAVCGCPAVGPDLPLVRDLLGVPAGKSAGSRGAIFSPTESGSLTTAVNAVVGEVSGSLRGHPGAGVGARANSHTAAAVAERLEKIYLETLAATSKRDGLSTKTPVVGHSLHVRGIG